MLSSWHFLHDTSFTTLASPTPFLVVVSFCLSIYSFFCRRDFYATVFQEVPWPSKERIWVQDSNETRSQLKELKKCCAYVSIRYMTKDVQIHEIYAKMQLVDYLSQVGGTISMWIGISFLTSYDLFEVIGDFFMKRTVRTQNKPRLLR